MDESWRMRIGMTGLADHRRTASADKTSSSEFSRRISAPVSGYDHLDPDDFKDVFGGPPRCVLSRKHSGEYNESDCLYTDVFRSTKTVSPGNTVGRKPPEFGIPSRNEQELAGFYDDVFGSGSRNWRSRSRSKSKNKSASNSSTVLSSEEMSPLRRGIGEDAALSSFASKLRPINVPVRWNSLKSHAKQDAASISCTDNVFSGKVYLKRSNTGYSQPLPSPETTCKEPTVWTSMGNVEVTLNSPVCSAVSTLCEDADAKATSQNNEEDEIASSYVIEIPSRESEAGDVDEAIRWAKGKFQARSSDVVTQP